LTIAVGVTATFSVAALALVAGPHGRPSALPVLAVAAGCCLRSTPVRTVHPGQSSPIEEIEEMQRG
jgi:hypothetical protein